MDIYDIIEELNFENGSNYKVQVLKKHSENELLKRVLSMTYDRAKYTYGVTLKQIEKFEPVVGSTKFILSEILDFLEHQFSTRNVTGHAALQMAADILGNCSREDAVLFKKIINRDLRINIGKTQINKVFKGLITKPSYCRCDVYSDKTAKNISFPAIVQKKADGTYREANVSDGEVEFRSRSGENYTYPILEKIIVNFPNAVYVGELTVLLTDSLLEKILPDLEKLDRKNGTENAKEILEAYNEAKSENKDYILPRQIGNGLINSDDVPHENLVFELWDCITHKEYYQASLKDRKNPCTTPYSDRFFYLSSIITNQSDMVKLIDHKIVQSLKEALKYTSKLMSQGYEGSVLKDWEMVFKDGTSKQQLKLKIKIDCEMRIVGFNPGTPGTKREGKVGSLIFGNDEGTVKGNCSGFSDDELDDMTDHPEKYLNKLFTVQFNDLSKARTNDYYSLSHPRFIELRTDKTETDTLERLFELREMAIALS